MAFRQPERQLRILQVQDDQRGGDAPALGRHVLPPLVESQTRIIFSPATDATTTTSSYSTPTHKTASTPGRSRLSDPGSLQSIAVQSAANDDDSPLSATYSVVIEDDAELDSLDSHLPEFRAGPSLQAEPLTFPHPIPVLPTHDGLGSFHLAHPAAGADVQEKLYAFEQFNPRRVKKRRESLELGQCEPEGEESRDAEKMRRIEAWRLEQSKYLLQEIKKETRRRGLVDSDCQDQHSVSQQHHGSEADVDSESKNTDWHEQDDVAGYSKKEEVTWTQTIKSVIREIIGIDENMLSILFGEALPDEGDDLSSTPNGSEFNTSQIPDVISRQYQNWQDRILARIARELGLLVHRLSDHPGAFSTYVRMQQMPLPYAGLPVIPEATVPDQPNCREASMASIQFQPTIKQAAQAIDTASSTRHAAAASSGAAQAGDDEYDTAFTQQEWEQELDVSMVFKYLRSRFTSQPAVSASSSPLPPTNSTAAASTANFGPTSTQDAAAKAARVRLHHPLVSRSRPVERRTFKTTVPSNPVALRHASSCASQSTRRSARRGGSGSSRHYWDIGASVGTGSIVASAAPMGNWGDV